MSFEEELTIKEIYIAMGGTRIADYDGDLGTGILVVSCCNSLFNEDTAMGVLRAKVKITINDGPYEGGTIEGTHNSKMIAFGDTSGKTVYNQGTGPLKGITINVKKINDGVMVEA